MFKKGEMVYYGTAGVCKVGDICKSPFDKNDDKIYYMLEPKDFSEGTVIYAPAEGGKVTLRAIMTKNEAEDLLSSMRTLLPLEIANERYRREEYRNALREGTPICMARLIKSVHERKKNALKGKKRLYDTDSEFDKIARRALLGELACVFGISEAEAEALVNSAMEI